MKAKFLNPNQISNHPLKDQMNVFKTRNFGVAITLIVLFVGMAMRPQTHTTISHPHFYDATGTMLANVIFPTGVETAAVTTLSPVYDATGSMLASVVFSTNVATAAVTAQSPVYDATGVMQQAVVYPKYPEALLVKGASPQP